MERLLPDEYPVYHSNQYESHNLSGAVIKQETAFNAGQHHPPSSRAIMHVSCENQHLSAGIDAVPSIGQLLEQPVERHQPVSTVSQPHRQLVAYGQNPAPHFQATGHSHSGRTSNRNAMRYCGVCGDVAKSYHFGGLSCDSCKAFFRRSVHNDNYLHFQCYHSGQCAISIANRKSCQYCRMRRCFSIGMEKSWVMTEEERRALMRTRAENRLKKQLSAVAKKEANNVVKINKRELRLDGYEPQVERMVEHLSITEINDIESVVAKYTSAYHQVPYRSQLCQFNDDRPGFQVMEMFGTLIRRFAVYARTLDTFTGLPSHDQRVLLKGGVMEMCILRGALLFDSSANRWPRLDTSPMLRGAPVLRAGDMAHLTSSPVFRQHMEFIASVQQLSLDEPSIMLLVLVVMFSNERPGLSRPERVEKCRAYYTSLLERYMDWRYGPSRSKRIFNKLLSKLSDLRHLCDAHTQENVRLGKEEFSSIQQQLQHLKINPYTKIQVVREDDDARPPDCNDSAPPVGAPTNSTLVSFNDPITSYYQQDGMASVSNHWYRQPLSHSDHQAMSASFESFESSPASTDASYLSSPGGSRSCSAVEVKQEATLMATSFRAGFTSDGLSPHQLLMADTVQNDGASGQLLATGELQFFGITHWPNESSSSSNQLVTGTGESSGSSLSAMEELFNDLERYSELHHYY